MKLHLKHKAEQDGAAVVHEMIYRRVEPVATPSRGHYLAQLWAQRSGPGAG